MSNGKFLLENIWAWLSCMAACLWLIFISFTTELEILGDKEQFFELEIHGHSSEGVLSASLKKTDGTILDRELSVRVTHPLID